MALFDISRSSSLVSRRPPVDDAYTEWFNAHSRCTRALSAWQAAEPQDRASAYRAYLAELDREEAAAAELARLQGLSVAA